MLVTTGEQGLLLSRPRSFVGLMGIYENNYLRLRRLLGDPARLPDRLISSAPRDPSLQVRILERCRYTTTLNLTYFFDEGEARVADPDLTVKVYHDARLVEASDCRHRHQHRLFRGFPTDASDELVRRWAMNRMLNKWLEYCIQGGHCFPGQTSQSRQA